MSRILPFFQDVVNPSVLYHALSFPVQDTTRPTTIKPAGPNRAMKLGSKAKDVDSFVDQLKSEGERVVSSTEPVSTVSPSSTPAVDIDV